MADSLQFHFWVHNRSNKALRHKSTTLEHGNFNNPENGAQEPISVIEPHSTQKVMVVTGAENSATGTEGTIVYDVDGTGQSVSMYWNVPWLAGTTNSCHASDSDDRNIVWVTSPESDTGRVLSTTATFAWLGD